jgi:predicted RNA-binding protein Jag
VTEQAQPQQSPSGASPGGDTRGRVEKLLPDILGLMGYPARLEFRDASDGSLAVALHFDAGAPPGVESGKRSQVLDSLQFLLNKMLHRPGAERRWVLLGASVFPEPRPRKEAQPPAPAPGANAAAAAPRPAAPAKAPAPVPPPAPVAQKAARPAPAPAAPPPAKRGEPDERTVEAAEDAVLKEAARQLAGKSGTLGRFYAIAAMKLEDRARVLKAVEGVAGVAVSGEGEGRCRRVVFTPEKPAPLPRKLLLPDDDEDDFEG